MGRLMTYDGVDLSYGEWGEDDLRPPVILQHGFAADSQMNWVTPGIVGALVLAGHKVFALDARGHGLSDAPHHSSYYGESKMAEDLELLLTLTGATSFDLVGYSLGAIVAMLVASRDSRGRRRVVGGVGHDVTNTTAIGRRVSRDQRLAAALRTDDIASIGDDSLRSFCRFADQTHADRLAMAAQAEAPHAPAIDLSRIQAETLVIAGEDDQNAGSPAALAAGIRGAAVCIVPGDHVSAVFGEMFRSTIVEFLE